MAALKEDLLALKSRLENIESKLEGQMKELEVRDEKWKRIESHINHLLEIENNEVIRFDVGGKKFATYKNTLEQKESLFSKIIKSSDFNLKEEIFFDRSPKYFTILLNFLRTGKFNYRQFKKDELEELLIEADYYELSEISTQLEEMKKDIEFIKMEVSAPYIYNGQTAGGGKIADLRNRTLTTGVCANSPGWIILELNATWEFDEMEVGGWNGNSSLWYNANGAGANIETSLDKISWKKVGVIPSNYGGTIQTVKLTLSQGKYVKFSHNSYVGLGYVGIKKKK